MPGFPRDLAAVEPWHASLERSRARRARSRRPVALRRAPVPALPSLRSLSAAHARQSVRDLASAEVWELSLGRSRARRRAAELRFVPAGSRAKRLSLGALAAKRSSAAASSAHGVHQLAQNVTSVRRPSARASRLASVTRGPDRCSAGSCGATRRAALLPASPKIASAASAARTTSAVAVRRSVRPGVTTRRFYQCAPLECAAQAIRRQNPLQTSSWEARCKKKW